MESKTKNVESKTAFGKLILRKIIKILATIRQILRLKCTEYRNPISAGAPPGPHWESLRRSQDSVTGFKGPTSNEKGRGQEGRERGGEINKREEREVKRQKGREKGRKK